MDINQVRSLDLSSGTISYERLSIHPSTRSITAITDSSVNTQTRIQNAHQLYFVFLKHAEKRLSDGTIIENGTVKVSNTSGATLTTANVLSALREREREQANYIKVFSNFGDTMIPNLHSFDTHLKKLRATDLSIISSGIYHCLRKYEIILSSIGNSVIYG